MMKSIRKRTSALIVSAVMAASTLSVLTAESLPVSAFTATSASSINKTMPTAVNSDDPDTPANQTECTFQCAAKTDAYTAWTDTSGKGPATFLGSESVKTLQFNFKADAIVTQFSYYFGCAADKSHDYWWDYKDPKTDEAYECHPYATEFSVVIEIPSYANLADKDGKFQIQNCYTATIDEATKKTTSRADITLVSIEANGTTDTSEGERPDWIPTPPDPNLPKAAENTGGLYYSSANYDNGSYDFQDNGDGTATITALHSLKMEEDALGYVLTPGDSCSEEYYAENAEEYGLSNNPSEADIRNADLPLNSHKFTYDDFNFKPGVNVSQNVKVKSLSVTLQAEDNSTNITRLMYGGGLNVEAKSPADTEYAKAQAGVKDDPNAGYWYNDIGADMLAECEEAGVDWGIEVGGGTDLAKQDMGSYITVTWDVPADVVDYVTTKTKDQISFQLWYVEANSEGGDSEALASGLKIVSAALTYEETITFPYSAQASVKNAGSESVGKPVEVNYSDFGMEYEKTADVYAVQFDVTLPTDANQAVVGAGTSVLEKLGLDYWYQSDDYFKNDLGNSTSQAMFYWEKTTAGSRPDASDTKTPNAAYKDAVGTKTYTYMWIMPPKVAEGCVSSEDTGAVKPAINNVSTEAEGDHVSFGVYYAGLGENTADTFSIDNVTVYYVADDTNNSAKAYMFEDELIVPDEIDVQVGKSAPLEVNVPGCSFTSSDTTKASAGLSENGKDADVRGKNITDPDDPVIITVTTPGGQVAYVKVNVLAEVTEVPATTTESKTTSATTTTKTTTTVSKTTDEGTGTVDTDYAKHALYGDVNLDGKVDLADAILLNKACADVVKLNGQALENSDCEYDHMLTVDDSLKLLLFLVQKVNSIGPEV